MDHLLSMEKDKLERRTLGTWGIAQEIVKSSKKEAKEEKILITWFWEIISLKILFFEN